MGLPEQKAYASTAMVQEVCYKCAVLFMVPEYFKQKRREDQQSFYCPNGHSQAYLESEVERVRKQLQSEKDSLQKALNWQISQTSTERQRAEQAERKLKRVGRGVCPQCNRSFGNLARHMACKHPEVPKGQVKP